MNTLTSGLCGKTRPIHFRGVCTVLAKLFNIVQPDKAYFGQKDAQQLAVVTHMVNDLNFNLEIIGCPIIREKDGLAKSSRNTYLSVDERQAALVLSKSLKNGRALIESGETNAKKVIKSIYDEISAEPLAKIDYVEIVSWPTLEEVDTIDSDILCAIAVYIGKVRLIDNFIIKK
jgi:pantoate--beta-alanine ligase